MAPHDQHSVVTGLAWVTTNAPLDLPFVSSVRVISVFQFSPDKPRLSEFQSNRTSVLNSLRLGWISVAAGLTKKNFRSRTISSHSDSGIQSPGASGSLRNRESFRAGR